MAKEPLTEPLLDLESGQATAPSTKAKATTTRRRDFHKSDGFLPDIFKIGEQMEQIVKRHPGRLMLQAESYKNGTKDESWAAWTHYYSTYQPAILRSIKLVFLTEQGNLAGKGTAPANGLMANMRLAVSGAGLHMIKAIQVAEKVKVMATEHKTVYSLLGAFLPTAQYTVLDGLDDEDLDNSRDHLEIEIMMKFIHLFCLMVLYAIPPVGTSILHHFKNSDARHCRILLDDPQELLPGLPFPDNEHHSYLKEKWSVEAPSDALTFRDYISCDFNSKFAPVSTDPFTPDDANRDPLHRNWLKLDSGLIFVLIRYYGYLKVNDNGNMTEEKILTEYIDTLSSCIGDLKAELELVQQMRAKMISSASTGFLSALTLLMHHMN